VFSSRTVGQSSKAYRDVKPDCYSVKEGWAAISLEWKTGLCLTGHQGWGAAKEENGMELGVAIRKDEGVSGREEGALSFG